jgi:dCMP deaminase
MSTGKREEYIGWDAYFMSLAAVASFRSKDPSTQNGACIVDIESLSPLSLGYNGFPRGCSDDEFPWAREAEKVYNTKYPYVEHAERNAIFNAARRGIGLNNSVIYIYSEKGYFPCDECARAIIQSGIKEVVMGFAINTNTDKYDWTATKQMFRSVGIKVRILTDLEIRLSDCETKESTSVAVNNSLNKVNKFVSDLELVSKKMMEVAQKVKSKLVPNFKQ